MALKKQIKSILCFMTAILILTGCKAESNRIETETAEQETVEVTSANKQLTEKEITLPWGDTALLKGFVKDKENNWIFYGDGSVSCKSSDEGLTWELQENEKLKEWFDTIEKENKVMQKETRMSESGDIIAWTASYEREEPKGEDIFGVQTVDYFYFERGKEPQAGEMSFSPQEYLADICIGANGEVFGVGMGKIFRINLKESRKEILFETNSASQICLKNQLLIVPDMDKVYIYDYKKRELQAEYRELNTFVRRQKGAVTFAAGEGKSLYILCKSGLYRYILGGSSIEMVSDSKRKAFGIMPENSKPLLGIAKAGMIFVSCDNKKLYFYSDKEVEETAKTKISMYRLQEETIDKNGFSNQDLELAISNYEERNPDIEIELQTGMSEVLLDSTLKTEDVIKNLNLEIAAGKGSDIIILDGLPAEEYQEKGMFEDISDIIAKVDETEGLFPQIVKHYRQEDGSIYQIPLGFTLNILWMPKELLKDSLTLEGLANAADHVRENENTEWELMSSSFQYSREVLEMLASSCMKAWINEEGGIRTEELADFFEMSEKVYMARISKYKQSPKYLERIETEPDLKMETFIKDIEGGEEELKKYLDTKTARNQRAYLKYNDDFLEAGILESGGNMFNRVLGDANEYNNIKNDSLPSIDFELFKGQTEENLFIPKKIAAINASSKNKEEAKKFLTYLLSKESDFGLHSTRTASDGSDRMLFSINKKIMEKDVESASVILELKDECRPDTAQIEKIKEIIETLEAPAMENDKLLKAVIEEGVKVIWKEQTPKEAADNVAKKMELFLAE